MQQSNKKLVLLIFILLSANAATRAQPYELTQTVVAGGGNSQATGGIYALDSTTGQAAAGNALRQSPFGMTVGFWNLDVLSPTATSVTVSGRVTAALHKGVFNARVSLTNFNGETRYAMTNSFGYYRFENVEVGETYVLDVRHKRFQFATQVVTVMEEIENLNFVADYF
ncbi:MAG: carboxypeptidase-like regulatory domain-containing protein [Pyrinomonadaceae bacterium]